MLKVERPESPYWFPDTVDQKFIDRFVQDGAEPWLRSRMLQLLEQRPGSVISAGCYVGGLIYWLAKHSEQVWTWDAIDQHVACTQAMLDHNNIINVHLAHAALADTVGTASITTGCENEPWLGGACSMIVDGQVLSPFLDLERWVLRTETVPQTRIDELEYDNVSILQLDLEGSEHLALAGAVETVHRWQPVIIIENNSRADQLLKLWGYTPVESRAGDTIYTR